MELVSQHQFPDVIELLCWIFFFSSQFSQYGHQFHFHQTIFILTVFTFISTHRCVSTSVVFEIKFSNPCWQTFCIFQVVVQFVKVYSGYFLTNFWHSFQTFFHTFGGFEHFSCWAAATVTKSVGNQDVVVKFFVLVSVPSTHDSVWMQHTVVCCEETCFWLTNTKCCNQVCKYFTSVNTFPPECIGWNFIELVPCQFCCHEIFDSRFLHNLWQSSAVTKYVWQPQNNVFFAKFFFEKSLTKQELTSQRFTRCQVTVSFYPHTAFCFPASFCYSLFNSFVLFWVTLFDKFI